MPRAPLKGAYLGPERRHRVTYVTRNTEYHFEQGVCVAVRDRTSGNWQLKHEALHRPLCGSIRISRGLEAHPSDGAPRLGAGLLFGVDGREVVTSNLVMIRRPEKTTIGCYPV